MADLKIFIKRLDKVFSEFIRLRDCDDNGMIKCYCCGKYLPWRESNNMHFIPRQHIPLRFSEVNCHAGCVHCNKYMNGNIEEYVIHLKKDYGSDIVERLAVAKYQTANLSIPELKLLINHYKGEVKELRKEKNINN